MNKIPHQGLIKNRFTSRRQFLKGTGSTFLMLPPLVSLMPKAVRANITGNPIRRSLCFAGALGIDKHEMYPDYSRLTDLQQIGDPAANIRIKRLADFNSPLSRVIDSSFSANATIRDKMNVIQGLSLTGGNYHGHNRASFCGVHEGDGDGRIPLYGKSIDVIMEKSHAVYSPDEAPTRKAVRIALGYHNKHHFSFDRDPNGNLISSDTVLGDTNLFNYLLNGLSTEGQSAASTLRSDNQKSIIDQVLIDLNALQDKRSRGLMSYEDELILQRFSDGVNEVSKRLQANAIICQRPDIPLEADPSKRQNPYKFPRDYAQWGIDDYEQMYENILDIIKISFECDLTRVITFTSNFHEPYQGNIHHEKDGGTREASTFAHRYNFKKMFRLAEKLDSITDAFTNDGSTLLDNSFMMCTNELGAWTRAHDTLGIPCITFGSQGGQFETGYYVNYEQQHTKEIAAGRNKPGRPYKQLLQSIMASIGVPKAEYMQYGDGNGFGQFREDINQDGKYRPDAFSHYKHEHNDPLPFLFKNA